MSAPPLEPMLRFRRPSHPSANATAEEVGAALAAPTAANTGAPRSAEQDALAVLDRVRDALGPFLLQGSPAGPAAEWYNVALFDPDRLRETGFAEHEVRALLGFWGRLKALVRCLRADTPLTSADVELYGVLTGHHVLPGRPGRASDGATVVRRLERVLDERLFRQSPDGATVTWYEAQLFNRHRLGQGLGEERARVVMHLWRRFRRALFALHPELAST